MSVENDILTKYLYWLRQISLLLKLGFIYEPLEHLKACLAQQYYNNEQGTKAVKWLCLPVSDSMIESSPM